jgi:UDP-4-amino-4,6-dideoxy-N-acetyl-beta-L-altrosamine transaminase
MVLLMHEIIPYGRQLIDKDDIDAVVSVLKSSFLTQGPMVPRFEDVVSNHVGAEYSVAVNNATSALHIACLALDLGPEDWLWTAPNTFVASANCALYCGAKVDFVDIDNRTYNMCTEALERKLKSAQEFDKLPKIVIPVHFGGQSCDMQRIYELSKIYGFKIIEDASHAIGGKYQNQWIGNCRYSDITVFSFHPVKIITTGEGGMALTNNKVLFNHMLKYRSHGITSDKSEMQSRPKNEIWNYQQIQLGFNYRMTDIQAALGVSQMNHLSAFVARRNEIATRYDRLLNGLPVCLPWQHQDNYSSYHLYPIRLDLSVIKKTQQQVYEALHQMKILANLHYIPVYLQPYYEKMGFSSGYCPIAEQYYKEALSIPMYPSMTNKQQDHVVDSLRRIIA